MAELHFFIGNIKYLNAQYNAYDGVVKVSMGAIDPVAYKAGKVDKTTRLKMNRLKAAVGQHVADLNLAGKPALKADIEKLIRETLNKKDSVKAKATFGDMFEKYRNMIVKEEILNEGKPYSVTVHKILSAVSAMLAKVPKVSGKYLDSITFDDLTLLKKYLLDKKKSQNTIRIYMEYVRSFLAQGHKRKWHNNPVYLEKGIKPPAEEQDSSVYLNNDEIKKLYELQLSRVHTEIRDYFVFGCLIGLRYDDVKRVAGFKLNDSVLTMNTKKRGVTVSIPLNAMAREIWHKYQGNFADRDVHHFNTVVRKLCEQAGMKEPVLWAGTVGGVKKQVQYEKWEMCSSHTMRRSFATNAYKAGVPSISIMKITGHKTEASFMKYIRLSNEENADLMLQHPHFQ